MTSGFRIVKISHRPTQTATDKKTEESVWVCVGLWLISVHEPSVHGEQGQGEENGQEE